ncbi:MAG: hypothetical protein KF688_18030 [Pirellulales bacterium]|nr:hypothetical protein [Pirellulales bacterium]
MAPFVTDRVLCGTVPAVINLTAFTEIVLRPAPDSEAEFFVAPNQVSPGLPVGRELRLDTKGIGPHVTLFATASDDDAANYLHILAR